MKKSVLLILVIAAGFAFLIYCQSGAGKHVSPENPKKMSMGMNLSSVTYWTRELPFVNVFLTAMPWVTQNDRDIPGAKNPWDTNLIASIPLDADGYPLSLPVYIAGAQTPQVAATLMCREVNGHYPSGQYVCLYEGEGDIQFGYDAVAIHKEPGRILLNVTPSHAGIFMKIARSNISNPIKNIRVIMPGFEQTYEKEIFNPQFLTRLKPFSCIRFMDWQGTNNSILKRWSERTKTSAYTQVSVRGVALEYMVALCNVLNADAWFCLPHQADDEFMLRFAQLVKERLRPELKVYLEYSNEVWNQMFDQYRWVEKNGSPDLTHPEKYAQLAANAFSIWSSVFASQEKRIVRVACGQQANVSKIKQVMKYFGENGVDAVSCSGYFGLSPKDYQILSEAKQQVDSMAVMHLTVNGIPSFVSGMKDHEMVAKSYKKEFIVYEGGQHIAPSPPGSHPAFINAFWEAQKSQEMYDAYRIFFNETQRTMEIQLFCAFSLASKQNTPFGSWGHLEYIDQPVFEAPKYRALLDHLGAGEKP